MEDMRHSESGPARVWQAILKGQKFVVAVRSKRFQLLVISLFRRSGLVSYPIYAFAVTRQLKSSCHSLLPQIDRIRRQIVISMIANESSQIDETGKIPGRVVMKRSVPAVCLLF